MLVVRLLVVAALGLSGAAATDRAATCHAAGGYRPPISAPVTDPFRAPASPFGPGNRGIEYASTPGQAVTAIGPGVVVFAGAVAGRLYVTVGHPDGLRSSYSFLGEVLVRVGEAVVRGQRLGRAGPVFHLGVRCGEAYLDPAALFARGGPPRLVPDRRFLAGASPPISAGS